MFVEPKTHQSQRTVQLGGLSCAALQERHERQAFERRTAAAEWQDRDPVFCTAFGTPLDSGRIHLNWVAALRKSGLPQVRVHDLRHTAATIMLTEGVHPKVVQEMLGHSSISVTLDIYSHVVPTMHREAVDRLDVVLGHWHDQAEVRSPPTGTLPTSDDGAGQLVSRLNGSCSAHCGVRSEHSWMMVTPLESTKTVFLTYAWEDNAEGDVDFIAQEIRGAGLTVEMDKVSFIPGRRLWDQIGEKITSSGTYAWGYVVTRASLQSEACREEYYLALNRALAQRGQVFPLIALVQGVPIGELPPSLEIRLAVHIGDADWIERVVAGVEGRAPRIPEAEFSRIALKWYVGPDANRHLEVQPRLETIYDWRVGIPLDHADTITNSQVVPSGAIPAASMNLFTVNVRNSQYRVVGSRGPIGNGMSAYLTVEGFAPEHLIVGRNGGPEYRVVVPSP